MYLIKEISEKDFNPDYEINPNASYKLRRASRAILSHNNKIAVIYINDGNYYKLPGGGVEANEETLDALKRELLEETGCSITLKKELGVILEYRDRINQLQISYTYVVEANGNPEDVAFTEDEVRKGARLLWKDKEELLELFSKVETEDYITKFIRLRDKSIIKVYLKSDNAF